MGHYTYKVLNPQVIEKTDVKLADACYHESIINALEYYSNNGFPQFKDTARFSKTFREWFNVVDVRNPEHGRRKKDHTRYPICNDDRHDTLSYLIKVHEWLQHWHDAYGVKQGFSKETFNAIMQTTICIPHLVDYLFDIKELDYVLLGFIQSDYLEQRFGWYKQLCGANYFNSVLQLLQAEKSIRIRSHG